MTKASLSYEYLYIFSLIVTLALTLTACGGGASDSSQAVPPPETHINYPLIENGTFTVNQSIDGSTFSLDDGSIWMIVGRQAYSNIDAGTWGLTIYLTTSDMPSPQFGISSNSYMLVYGYPHVYYIEPLTSPALISATGTFTANPSIDGNTFSLDDGSIWMIVGRQAYSGIDAGKWGLTIHSTTSNMPPPQYGVGSTNYMLVDGYPHVYYINSL